MCVETSRHQDDGGNLDAAVAGSFAADSVLAVVETADRDLASDARTGLVDMVSEIGGNATEVVVTVHHDHVELVATNVGRMQHRLIHPRHPLATKVPCELS